jgi:RHS repeat-associated protein
MKSAGLALPPNPMTRHVLRGRPRLSRARRVEPSHRNRHRNRLTSTYTYDANGNMLTGGGRTMTYTAFNVPATIANASTTQSFTFDPEHNRITQVETGSGAAAGTTLYLNGGGVMCELFTAAGTGVATWRSYIVADGETKALVEQIGSAGPYWGTPNWGAFNWTSAIASTTILYLHSDHLGSIAAITGGGGSLTEQDAYDGWGKRRNLNGTDDTLDMLTSATTRGYTNQEQLGDVALLHLNGRVYDPQIAKFTSADPLVGNPLSTQGWNRYSYVGNNPLAYTDPTGMCFLGCFWKSIFRSPVFRDVVAIVVAIEAPELLEIYGIAGAPSAEVANLVNIGVAGAAAGAISTGTFKGAAIGAITADAFFEVGSATGFHGIGWGDATKPDNLGWFSANIAGHAAVGCASSAASGGSCGSGALSGAFGAVTGPLTHDLSFPNGLAVTTLSGGLGSILGGGKFENGAITGAFGYLFNELAHRGGKLWATQPTADEYAAHYADGTGETVYREGSDVNLGEYPSGQFDAPAGSVFPVSPSSVSLGAALLNWEAGTLGPGALTDTFLYGSFGRVQALGNGFVQLGPDTFNFNMESGRPFRNWMTQLQHNTLGGGLPGKDFQTIFVGPTKAP